MIGNDCLQSCPWKHLGSRNGRSHRQGGGGQTLFISGGKKVQMYMNTIASFPGPAQLFVGLSYNQASGLIGLVTYYECPGR